MVALRKILSHCMKRTILLGKITRTCAKPSTSWGTNACSLINKIPLVLNFYLIQVFLFYYFFCDEKYFNFIFYRSWKQHEDPAISWWILNIVLAAIFLVGSYFHLRILSSDWSTDIHYQTLWPLFYGFRIQSLWYCV